jgi:hypothetical protein
VKSVGLLEMILLPACCLVLLLVIAAVVIVLVTQNNKKKSATMPAPDPSFEPAAPPQEDVLVKAQEDEWGAEAQAESADEPDEV